MIRDLEQSPDSTDIEADLCIIGAGMAGLTVARELMATKHRIVLLETGQLDRTAIHDALNETSLDGPHRLDVVTTRPRVLGGGSVAWGSFCTPLDPADFAPTAGRSLSGWPFGLDILAPYYQRAQQQLELGPPYFDERLWPLFGVTPPAFDSQRLRTKFWQFRSPSLFPLVAPLRFGKAYRAELAAAPDCTVVLNATVTALARNADGQVESAAFRSLGGRTGRVRAGCFLLAAGAIENARLLLISDIGNQHDMVGRCFMEHPHVTAARLTTSDAPPLLDTWAIRRRRQGVALQPSLCPTPQLQETEDILNCCLAVEIDRDPACPTQAVATIGEALRSRHAIPEPMRNIGRIVSDPGTFWRNAYRRVVHGSGVLPRVRSIQLYCRSEQEPNPDSRIKLDRERDALGMPRVRLAWTLTERDRRTVAVFTRVVADELARLGLARATMEPWLAEATGWPTDLRGGPHHSGTTRMADDPRQGVVDRDGLVHGLTNLYVTGASTFPTGGYVNPGLTVVALALRTADHLRDRLPGLLQRH